MNIDFFPSMMGTLCAKLRKRWLKIPNVETFTLQLQKKQVTLQG